ncbi:sulfite exporter TauE/SafE family protein [Bacillus sp. M6-12]|uniref:sulfite exporter TauE/SafE family protein n=1 Tax=Bacillus sp. M6-12 TaxID=2054166 RepID=UPI000C769E88|nr:sulfite exporter TauE/SafE family protein [Bacillus sp. M6-12]PLS16504.1 sulfite exporter TauE/SafE family protein [Bacillus sp. M6-12]
MTEILLILIGFCASFIGTLAGSGGLIGMPSLLLIGIPIHSVIATAKFSNVFSSFSSFYILLKQKELSWRDAATLIPFALGGGMAGGLLANSFSEKTMTVLAVFLLSGALAMNFLKKPKGDSEGIWKLEKKAYPTLFGISVYDGMFGPGQSTLLMYAFLHQGASYLKALALTRAQTFISCAAAFATYLFAGNFKWEIAIYYALGGIFGAQFAVRVARRLSKEHLKVILHLVTVALIVQLLIRLWY